MPIDIYPNPAIDYFMIEIELDRYQGNESYFSLTNSIGKVILKDPLVLDKGINKHKVFIKDFNKGIYIIRLHGTKDLIGPSKLIIH